MKLIGRYKTTLADQLAVAIRNAQSFDRVATAQQIIRENEARLVEAERIANMGAWTWDIVKSEITWTDGSFILSGLEPGSIDVNFDAWVNTIHPDDRQNVLDTIQNALDNHERYNVEYRSVWPSGDIKHIYAEGYAAYDDDDNPLRMTGVIQDITARKETEQRELIALEIGQEMNRRESIQELLQFTVDRLAEAFQYYHVHVYRFDPRRETLTVAAGLGQAGERMVRDQHSINYHAPASLVASAARSLQPILVQDVMDNPNHLPNPLIPRTRSEISIPLFIGDNLLGVLDIQSDQPNAFDDSEARLLSIVGSQLSVAFSNAIHNQEIQQRAAEIETIAGIGAQINADLNLDHLLKNISDSIVERLNRYYSHIYLLNDAQDTLFLAAGAGEVGDVLAARGHQIALSAERSLVARAARSKEVVVIDNVRQEPDWLANDLLPETRSEMAVPILLGDELIGVLDIQDSKLSAFSAIQAETKYILANQIAVAIRNAETFEHEQESRRQNEQRAAELETVAQVSTTASNILDVDELVHTISELTKAAFDLYHAHIYLFDEQSDQLVLAGGAGEAGQIMVTNGHAISLQHPTSIVARAGRERRGVMVNDVYNSPTFMPNPMLPETRSELAVPMLVGDQLIGVMDVQSAQENNFDRNDMQIKTILAAQVAVSVQNAWAFQRSQEIAERERATADRLREVDQLKSQFLASMSHELRTPLNSIIGYSEVLIDGGDGELPEEAVEDIEIIYTSGRHLLAIINDILDLAKIEAQQMHLNREDMDIVQILRDIIKTNQILVGNRPIDLILDSEVDELVLPIDEIRIRQVLLNLFSNAVKFTDEGSVTISLNMLDNETARVAVTDTGMGISEEGQKIVFDQFRQVDGTSTRKKGGTGLGLTITRYLVQMHGGEIEVESEVGKGTTFWFTLPLITPEEEPEITIQGQTA